MDLRSLTMDELTGVINLYPWFGGARKELCVRMAKVGGSEWGKAQYSEAAMYVASRSLVSDIIRSAREEDYSDKDVERLINEYLRPSVAVVRPVAVVRQAHQPVEAPGVVRQAHQPVEAPAVVRQAHQPVEAPGVVRPAHQPVEAPGVVRQAHQPAEAQETDSLVAEPVEAAGNGIYSSPSNAGYTRSVRVAGGDFFSPEQYAAVRKDEDSVFSGFRSDRSDEPDDRSWEDPEFGFCTETLAAIYADQGYFTEAKKIYSRLILRYPEKSAYFASLIEKLQQEN